MEPVEGDSWGAAGQAFTSPGDCLLRHQAMSRPVHIGLSRLTYDHLPAQTLWMVVPVGVVAAIRREDHVIQETNTQ